VIPLLSSLGSQFRTGWLSKAPFPEELVAQTLNTDIRFDPPHPRKSEGIGWMERMHLFVICPCSGAFIAFLGVKIPPIEWSAGARLTRVATDRFGREFVSSGPSRRFSYARVPHSGCAGRSLVIGHRHVRALA
jgi:hypothetical protein